MKKRIRILILLLAAALCGPTSVSASPSNTALSDLEAYLAPFWEKYGLNENNFSMGYCFTGSGDTWYFNGEKMMIGGSLYKLPLNMRITEKIQEGVFSESDWVGGHTLAEAQYLSMVHSDNAVSQALQKFLVGYSSGYYYAYRQEIAKYSGDFLEDIPPEYYSGNYFSAEFMLNTLSYLYDHAEQFSTILGYMEEAQPDDYFNCCDVGYPVAHKYGYYGGYINDAGIIYTPTPFLLVAFTYNLGCGEQVLGELCSLMCDYTLSLIDEIEAEEEAARLEAEEAARSEAEEAARLEAEEEAEEEAARLEALRQEEEAKEEAAAQAEEAAEAEEPPSEESGGEEGLSSGDAIPVLIIAAAGAVLLLTCFLLFRRKTVAHR